MESLNLNGLAKSLPASNFEKADKELLNNFKAAALSITTLYRSSRNASKRAYNAGYAAACQDLMIMIQRGVSAGAIAPCDNALGGEMTVGRILDWIEARMEAVKAREEEEDEDEEREKERERARGAPPSARPDVPKDVPSFSLSPSQKASQTAPARYRPEDSIPAPAPLTPHSPVLLNSVNLPHPSSPSPTITPARPAIISANPRITRARPSGARKDLSDPAPVSLTSTTCFPATPSENILRVPAIAPISALPDGDLSAGAKRRHAVMMMLDAAPSTATVDVLSPSGSSTPSAITPASGNSRRRTRSQRGAGHVQMPVLSGDSMDVEEDGGPQRKRVSRR